MPSAPTWRVLSPGLVDRLAESPEPAARWIALTELLARDPTDSEVIRTHQQVLDAPLTEDLLGRLVPWEVENPISGHDRPAFAPNLLGLLTDLGVTAADDERIRASHAAMLAHQAPDGRFLAFGRTRVLPEPVWAALPCDSHAILETLVRAGAVSDPRVIRALERLAADLTDTSQLPDAARTLLGIWRDYGVVKPYPFGHGRQFKTVKWPATWYSARAAAPRCSPGGPPSRGRGGVVRHGIQHGPGRDGCPALGLLGV